MVEGSSTIITGTLGAGKTLMGADIGMERLSTGGTVVTNVPMDRSKLRDWMAEEYGKKMADSRLQLLENPSIREFHKFAIRGNERWPAMLILDEAGMDLNSRDHATLPRQVFEFVALCRKMKVDLVLIAQDANHVDKQIRGLMQKEVHCRSLKNIPGFAGLPVFIRVHYTLEAGKKPWRTKWKFHWKSQSWGYFDSHGLHGARAKEFAALDQADSTDLERIKYPLWPYATIGAATVAAAAASTCLFVN